ncbi:efflux RND transporter permease subunit [Halomonas llamarensis]|uniref:Efflux RND transporter permease subunit n=1 Tax=Halomonas llamarensis TaxID=2945104 RepID=A0ABT0SQN5_9GAMM|nr:efflux RND transporter permease subunit [Halomonas llamarensis]MCL7930092.1 efflux RND transporter permease subunit [Halomonas llamarensis]
MRVLTAWFIRNSVAANLLMTFILLVGLVTLNTMRIEGFPRIEPDSITITTVFPGAPPNKVDTLISQKIETALEGLEGVRSLSAISSDGVSTITVRRASGQSLDKLLDKVRLRMDSGIELPTRAERPQIDASGFDYPALYINVYGDAEQTTLHELAKRLRKALLAQPTLSRLNVWGLHKQELRIEVDSQKLRQLNLTVPDVVERIRASSLEFQAGSLRTRAGRIYIRADSEAEYAPEYGAIAIVKKHGGDQVLLRDIAIIQDTTVEGDYRFRFNGQPSSGMEILVGQRENLLHISEVTHGVLHDFRRQLPRGVDVVVWGDSADYIGDRLSLLTKNGLQGLVLVVLILALFLDVKLAFWVAMGIPVSVLGAIAVSGTSWVDYSLNDITTFGFILALGILVDDAVVVGEGVFEQRRLNNNPIAATEAGVAKVSVATVFGVLTTIAAFFPLLILDNPLGKVLASFSGVVILALVFSLVESKFILPVHLAGIDLGNPPKWLVARLWQSVQLSAQAVLFFLRDRCYVPLLSLTVRHRYAALIFFISVAVLVLGLTMKGMVKSVFFPEVPGQVISITLEMDSGAPFELTRANVEHIRREGEAVSEFLQQQHDLDQPPVRTTFEAISSAESAAIYAELTPVAARPGIDIQDVIQRWRQQVGQLEGSIELRFTGSEEIGGGFQIKLTSGDQATLVAAGNVLKDYLDTIGGVHNPRDSMAGAQAELAVTLKPSAENLGFDQQTLAMQISAAFGGAEVQKVQRDDTELAVLVQYGIEQRNTMDDLLQSHIRNHDDQWVLLSAIANVEQILKPKAVYRENNHWVNLISATIDRTVIAPEEVAQAIFSQLVPQLQQQYPDLGIHLGGELEEMGELQGGLKKALLIAMILIYMLMAVPLKSYWQPFIILAIIPFGFVGAILGHLYLDLALSLLSVFGMLALAGVVVNDSLVMLSRHNELVADGMVPYDAIQAAATSRFRAIFLTTTTTVIGLLPLLSESSEQAQYLKPAAASLAFGELFSTVLMLFLVPVLIAITQDLKRPRQVAPSTKPPKEPPCYSSQ